jgi:hypothetical protein
MLIDPINTWFIPSACVQPVEDFFVFIDTMHIASNNKSIYFQIEPEAIIASENHLIENYNKYTYIITFNQNILNKCPNAIKYIYGTSWLDDTASKSINMDEKKFKVSSVFGNKLLTPAHMFRRNIILNRNIITSIPYDFYLSWDANFIDENEVASLKKCDRYTKIDLFKDVQFHIVIENSRQVNYFTEKLLDTLNTYTIPIYYGCPNIDEFFDTTGWIILESMDIFELNVKLMSLDVGYYKRHYNIILENYKRSREYSDLYVNLNRALKNLPEFKQT